MKVTLIDHMGSDLTVVNAARVSFNKESDWEDGPVKNVLPKKDQQLISYLAKHNHWTPFAHCFIQLRIKAPLFVARQLGKHQIGLVWNEVSRRYVDYEPKFYYPNNWREKPYDKKQGSSKNIIDDQFRTIRDSYQDAIQQCEKTYQQLLKENIAPEMARMVLPQSMYTEWYWSGSIVAFARVCNLRLKEDAQEETNFIAQEIDKKCSKLFPVSWKYLVQVKKIPPEKTAE